MKASFTLLGIMLFTTLLGQQNYRSPRGVDYDAIHQRYIVANYTSSTLLSVVPGSAPTVFASGVTNCKGVVVVGDTVYVVSANDSLKAYNLSTGLQVFNLRVSSNGLSGICTDWAGNLFITDLAGKRIVKFNIATRVFSYFFSWATLCPPELCATQLTNA
jgi:DNA-binding beta-propeller fold protein YncE